MPAKKLYQQIHEILSQALQKTVYKTSIQRLIDLTMGMIVAQSAAPARIAVAMTQMQLSNASASSHERRIRRIENDPELTQKGCLHPLIRDFLRTQIQASEQDAPTSEQARPERFLIALDATEQEDRATLLAVTLCYRGRSLPLAWDLWPAGKKLEGPKYWERVRRLFQSVQALLGTQTPIVCLADRAYGAPVFLDLVRSFGWNYVTRAQGQTRYRDHHGREHPIRSLLSAPGQRHKQSAYLFKKAGWRLMTLISFWGHCHKEPFYLMSDLSPSWEIIDLYRTRFAIEPTFRDFKSQGWRWEDVQVTDGDHMERLLVAMALATWLVLLTGAHCAQEYLSKPATGRRRTLPWEGKRSLFQLGLARLGQWLMTGTDQSISMRSILQMNEYTTKNWQSQCYQHHAKAYIFAATGRT